MQIEQTQKLHNLVVKQHVTNWTTYILRLPTTSASFYSAYFSTLLYQTNLAFFNDGNIYIHTLSRFVVDIHYHVTSINNKWWAESNNFKNRIFRGIVWLRELRVRNCCTLVIIVLMKDTICRFQIFQQMKVQIGILFDFFRTIF